MSVDMVKRIVTAVVAIMVLCTSRGLGAAEEAWTKIVPGTTSQAEFVRMFGEPKQGVRVFFPEFMSLMDRKPVAKDCCYFLDYFIEQDLVREGPLGEAWEASVWVGFDRVVGGVDWRYQDGYRFHARTHEARSAISLGQIKAFAARAEITLKPFNFPGADDTAGSYSFTVNRRSFTVLYQGAGSDITVEMR
jgi:hypothetical protein